MKSSRFPDIPIGPDESIDDFMDGRLRLIQSRTGYRVSIDALLLSDFVTTKPEDLVVDLGTGSGIILLILLLTRRIRYAVGLEIQEDLAEKALRNASINGYGRKMGVVRGDIRHPPLAPSTADVVVCNPPYRKPRSGRINPDRQRAIARHEIMSSLDDILDAARRLLKPKGRLAMIYSAARFVELLVRLRGLGLEPKRVRVIHPHEQSEAKLVLVEASREGGEGVKILPPIVDQGSYSI